MSTARRNSSLATALFFDSKARILYLPFLTLSPKVPVQERTPDVYDSLLDSSWKVSRASIVW